MKVRAGRSATRRWRANEAVGSIRARLAGYPAPPVTRWSPSEPPAAMSVPAQIAAAAAAIAAARPTFRDRLGVGLRSSSARAASAASAIRAGTRWVSAATANVAAAATITGRPARPRTERRASRSPQHAASRPKLSALKTSRSLDSSRGAGSDGGAITATPVRTTAPARIPSSRPNARSAVATPTAERTVSARIGASGPPPVRRLTPASNAFSATLLTVGTCSTPHWTVCAGIRPASAISSPSAQYRKDETEPKFSAGETVRWATVKAATIASAAPARSGSAGGNRSLDGDGERRAKRGRPGAHAAAVRSPIPAANDAGRIACAAVSTVATRAAPAYPRPSASATRVSTSIWPGGAHARARPIPGRSTTAKTTAYAATVIAVGPPPARPGAALCGAEAACDDRNTPCTAEMVASVLVMRRKTWALSSLAATVLVAGGAGAAWWAVHQRTGDIHRGGEEPFTLTSDPLSRPTRTASTAGITASTRGPRGRCTAAR